LNLENCNIEAVANIASYFYYKNQSEISVKLYQRLVELGYDAAEIWNNLALCCFAVDQYDVFYTCFERALRLAEDNSDILSDIWYNIGNVYIVVNDIEMAVQAYNLSLQFVPDNCETLNNLGVIMSRQGKAGEAINYAEKSFRSQANFEAAYNLSIWYFSGSQF
jgi:tetratricopeptide repeat protein 8